MTCKACGQPYGCDHSDAEYQGVVPPARSRRERKLASALSGLLAIVDRMDKPASVGGGVLPVEKALATGAARRALADGFDG